MQQGREAGEAIGRCNRLDLLQVYNAMALLQITYTPPPLSIKECMVRAVFGLQLQQ